MSVLTNTAIITHYTYPIGPNISGTGSTIPMSLSITVDPAPILFTVTNAPEYIRPGETSVLTYSITNLNSAPLTTATLVNPLFTLAGVTVSNLKGAVRVGNTLNIILPTGGLLQYASIHITANITVSSNAISSHNVYNTRSTGTFTLTATPPRSITQTIKGHLEVNSAYLSISKSVLPNTQTITAGNLLTYTITIANAGNVAAYIPVQGFVDTWTPNSLTNVSINDSRFTVNGCTLTNIVPLNISVNEPLILILTGIANA